MSPVSKKFLRSSVIYFVVGLLVQAITLFDLWLGFNPLAYTAVNITIQMLLIGWLSQLGLALVYNIWLEPLRTDGVSGAGRASRGAVIFGLFNLGLPLVIIGQPGVALLAGGWIGFIGAVGGLCQLAAGLIFLVEVLVLLRHSMA